MLGLGSWSGMPSWARSDASLSDVKEESWILAGYLLIHLRAFSF